MNESRMNLMTLWEIYCKHKLFWWLSLFLIVICLFTGFNLALLKIYHISFRQSGTAILVSEVSSKDKETRNKILPGDEIVMINGRQVTTVAQANWILQRWANRTSLPITVIRNGEELSYNILPVRKYTGFNVLLLLVLGITAYLSGLLALWYGRKDRTALAYSGMAIAWGTSVFLTDYMNIYQNDVLHYLYVFLWKVAYSCLMPALFEFTQRYTRLGWFPRLKEFSYKLLFLPYLVACGLMCYYYYRAASTLDAHWIALYENFFYRVFNPLLIIPYIATIVMFVYRYRHPENLAEKSRLRWIIIIQSISSFPFFVLYKIPTIFGLQPLIPVWLALTIMMIAPIGWGMAIASFRMFKLEWVFSRSVIYYISFTVVTSILVTFSTLGMDYFSSHSTASLIVLIGIGLVAVYFITKELVELVRSGIDKIYYHDWYNYRLEMSNLTGELTRSLSMDRFISLMTEKLPTILQIEYASLLMDKGEHTREIFSLSDSLTEDRKTALLLGFDSIAESVYHASDKARFDLGKTSLEQAGYRYLLPLRLENRLAGVLILGQKHSGAPFSEQDHNLLSSFSLQAAITLENIFMQNELFKAELEKQQGIYRQQELERARVLQQSLLPQAELSHGCYRVSSLSRTATEVGGDYYDFFPLSDGKLVIVIGDVSGHGMSSGLLMAMVKSSLSSIMPFHPEVTSILATVNHVVRAGGASQKMFLTFCILLFDPVAKTVTCSVNGHPLPLLLRANGVASEFGVSSYPLGIREYPAIQVRTYNLAVGDRILLITDGLPELMNDNQEAWGYSNLQLCLAIQVRLHGTALLESILSAAYEHAGNHPQDDDIALVCIEVV